MCSSDLWDHLNQFYESNYREYSLGGELLVIKVDKLDYVHHPEDRAFMVNEIRKAKQIMEFKKASS